jgi:hypothetical protein
MNTGKEKKEHVVTEIYFPLGSDVPYLRRTSKPMQCDDPELQTCSAENYDKWLKVTDVPSDLAGFQHVVIWPPHRGDLMVVQQFTCQWFTDEEIKNSHLYVNFDSYKAYRKIPVANHASIASPEVKSLIEEHKKIQLDPKGSEGKKKPQLQLIPPVFNIQVADALAFGGEKYGPWNWRKNKVEYMTYLGAMKRHIDALLEGENTAPDSGVHHLGHIAASCAIVLDATKQCTLVDNRPTIPNRVTGDGGAYTGVESPCRT